MSWPVFIATLHLYGVGYLQTEELLSLAKQNDDMRQWARMGAEQRLVQLAEEQARIYRMFRELRHRTSSGPSATAAQRGGKPASDGEQPARKRRRRRLSAEARKRISEAQKKRWAKQRNAA